MAQGAPLAQAAVKKLMRNATSMSYAEVVDQEAVEQSKLIESDDSRNAIAAFFAKRKAVFKGK
jgi:2-(1,2-epoxy-1,2-dihydrophenyl)acetyl-CoA isomerase